MNGGLGRKASRTRAGRQVGVISLVLAVVALGQRPGQGSPAKPRAERPRTVLAFSASPTTEELFRARVFEEPLVPVRGEPTAADNAALAAALEGYAKRTGPDDFASLTDFLEQHPQSPWRAALLTGLGSEYYHTAHYSLALGAWREAWTHAADAQDARAKRVVDRAVSELAYLDARLGRMSELEALLKSVQGRMFFGRARQQINGATEALGMMKSRPEISFRCGPLALQSIRRALDPHAPLAMAIFNSASTRKGFSLTQVAGLSGKVGLNYQMAFREPGEAFIVPSVMHWKVGHYAAIVRQVGDRYLVEDPTFGNTVWPTTQALEEEASGDLSRPAGQAAQGLAPGGCSGRRERLG